MGVCSCSGDCWEAPPSHAALAAMQPLSLCPTATLGREARTYRTPSHCCRVRLLCDASMSHPQLFPALLELGRAPGFVPQPGRGQFRPHCQGLMLCISGGDFGSEHHCCLLTGFCPVPLPCPHPLSLSHLPFIPAPICHSASSHSPPNPLLILHPCPVTLPPCPMCSSSSSSSISGTLTLHLCSLCPPSSPSCSLQPPACNWKRFQQQTGGSGTVSFVPVPVWEHWRTPSDWKIGDWAVGMLGSLEVCWGALG